MLCNSVLQIGINLPRARGEMGNVRRDDIPTPPKSDSGLGI